MKICFIVDKYPSETFPAANAFVETLVNEMTEKGIQCYVISPQSCTNALVHRRKLLPYTRERTTNSGKSVKVITPKYWSFSGKKIGRFNLSEITLLNFRRAAERAFKKLQKDISFDVIYGHFIFESGIVANYLGKKYGIPSFFAYGENTTYTIDYLGAEKTRKLLENITGVISVSSENKRVLLSHNLVDAEKIGIFPNSVDLSRFYIKDKYEMREKLGFPKDGFIIAFTGRLLTVKGPERLSSAIKEIKDEKLYSFFLGEGPLKPDCENVLFCDVVQHHQINDYLNAADIFVLPTLAEGCCNSIVEAMACGLPIVSSALPFNDDILTKDNSIRINPENVDEIKNAIIKLKDNSDLRYQMSQAALNTAKKLTIEKRAENIINFIQKQA